MSKLMQLLAVCLGALLWLWQPLAHAQPAKAGYLITAGAGTTALGKDGATRKLERRSPVYEGDTIITTNSAAQIRFADGSLTSLRSGTRFKVETFSWNGTEDGSEKSFFSLIKGGLRTITGAIGKRHKDNYQMKTPVATIGIRGTTYELIVGIDKNTGKTKVTGVVIQGAIVLFKPGVSTYVGATGDSHFRVTVNADGSVEVETSSIPYEEPVTEVAGDGTGNEDGGTDDSDGGDNGGDDDGGTEGTDEGGSDETTTTPDQTTTTEITTETQLNTERTTITRVLGSALDKCTKAGGCRNYAENQLDGGGGSVEVGGAGTETVTLGTVNGVENVVTNIKDTDPADPWEMKTGTDAGGVNQLTDFGTFDSSDISWNWGRWGSGNWDDSCGDCEEVGSFLFIVGRGVTTTSELEALKGTTATFGGTSVSGIAVDHNDQKLTIKQLGFTADFTNRLISGFYLEVGKAGESFQSGLVQQYDTATNTIGGTVSFTDALGADDGDGIELRRFDGVGSLEIQGGATVEFLGTSAGQAVGSFGLVNSARDVGAAGVYAIEKNN